MWLLINRCYASGMLMQRSLDIIIWGIMSVNLSKIVTKEPYETQTWRKFLNHMRSPGNTCPVQTELLSENELYVQCTQASIDS